MTQYAVISTWIDQAGYLRIEVLEDQISSFRDASSSRDSFIELNDYNPSMIKVIDYATDEE